jgi:hypothetical protein
VVNLYHFGLLERSDYDLKDLLLAMDGNPMLYDQYMLVFNSLKRWLVQKNDLKLDILMSLGIVGKVEPISVVETEVEGFAVDCYEVDQSVFGSYREGVPHENLPSIAVVEDPYLSYNIDAPVSVSTTLTDNRDIRMLISDICYDRGEAIKYLSVYGEDIHIDLTDQLVDDIALTLGFPEFKGSSFSLDWRKGVEGDFSCVFPATSSTCVCVVEGLFFDGSGVYDAKHFIRGKMAITVFYDVPVVFGVLLVKKKNNGMGAKIGTHVASVCSGKNLGDDYMGSGYNFGGCISRGYCKHKTGIHHSSSYERAKRLRYRHFFEGDKGSVSCCSFRNWECVSHALNCRSLAKGMSRFDDRAYRGLLSFFLGSESLISRKGRMKRLYHKTGLIAVGSTYQELWETACCHEVRKGTLKSIFGDVLDWFDRRVAGYRIICVLTGYVLLLPTIGETVRIFSPTCSGLLGRYRRYRRFLAEERKRVASNHRLRGKGVVVVPVFSDEFSDVCFKIHYTVTFSDHRSVVLRTMSEVTRHWYEAWMTVCVGVPSSSIPGSAKIGKGCVISEQPVSPSSVIKIGAGCVTTSIPT